jgi:two-component system, sensor histidine kinase and response regulator
MIDAKQQAITSIVQARSLLESALTDMEKLPAFDPSTVPFAAHALSNFLSVTERTVELLRKSLPEKSSPDVVRMLEGLRHATSLMMHTVSQLINNVSVGELKFRFEKIDLPHMVGRACAYYERFAVRKHIRLTFDDTADVPLIWSDRVAVAAVLDNLLSNAVKYSPIGESVHVKVGTRNGHAICSVQDEGPGISPDDQRLLFQRGVRLNTAPTGGEASSGYGLAVAKELIEQLGGTIWVDSVQGQGACFSFRLPTLKEASQDKEFQGQAPGLP